PRRRRLAQALGLSVGLLSPAADLLPRSPPARDRAERAALAGARGGRARARRPLPRREARAARDRARPRGAPRVRARGVRRASARQVLRRRVRALLRRAAGVGRDHGRVGGGRAGGGRSAGPHRGDRRRRACTGFPPPPPPPPPPRPPPPPPP